VILVGRDDRLAGGGDGVRSGIFVPVQGWGDILVQLDLLEISTLSPLDDAIR
jgi:hypothetical protein